MAPENPLLLPFEEFMAFIVAHFESQGHILEERKPAPTGQLLLFRRDGKLSVAYCISNPPLPDDMWKVDARDVRWCVNKAETLTAACGYVITRSDFSFGAEKEARYAGMKISLVNGRALMLKQWIS